MTASTSVFTAAPIFRGDDGFDLGVYCGADIPSVPSRPMMLVAVVFRVCGNYEGGSPVSAANSRDESRNRLCHNIFREVPGLHRPWRDWSTALGLGPRAAAPPTESTPSDVATTKI